MANDTFKAAAYRWLIDHGHVRSFYGTAKVTEHLHIAACGVDLDASDEVAEGFIDTFTDTFSEPHQRRAVVGEAVCNCGRPATLEHPPLSVGELLTAVAAHDIAEVPDPPEIPAGTQIITFAVDGTTVRAVPATSADDSVQLQVLGIPQETFEWATLCRVLGAPQFFGI